MVRFILLYEMVVTFKSMVEVLKCDFSNKCIRIVLLCGAAQFAIQGGCN